MGWSHASPKTHPEPGLAGCLPLKHRRSRRVYNQARHRNPGYTSPSSMGVSIGPENMGVSIGPESMGVSIGP